MKRFFTVLSALLLIALIPVSSTALAFTYYLPYYYNETKGTAATGVALTNLSETVAAAVTINVFNQDGSEISTYSGITLPPNGQWVDKVGDGSDASGWISIESDQQIAGLCFVDKDQCIMDVPITETLSKKLVIPHSAQNQRWDTIAYVANPNSSKVELTITMFDQEGEVVAAKSYSLNAGASGQYKFSEILDGATIASGSVQITSDIGVTGYVLYNDRKYGFFHFAGINAHIP
jgi:hypothetical protein